MDPAISRANRSGGLLVTGVYPWCTSFSDFCRLVEYKSTSLVKRNLVDNQVYLMIVFRTDLLAKIMGKKADAETKALQLWCRSLVVIDLNDLNQEFMETLVRWLPDQDIRNLSGLDDLPEKLRETVLNKLVEAQTSPCTIKVDDRTDLELDQKRSLKKMLLEEYEFQEDDLLIPDPELALLTLDMSVFLAAKDVIGEKGTKKLTTNILKDFPADAVDLQTQYDLKKAIARLAGDTVDEAGGSADGNEADGNKADETEEEVTPAGKKRKTTAKADKPPKKARIESSDDDEVVVVSEASKATTTGRKKPAKATKAATTTKATKVTKGAGKGGNDGKGKAKGKGKGKAKEEEETDDEDEDEEDEE